MAINIPPKKCFGKNTFDFQSQTKISEYGLDLIEESTSRSQLVKARKVLQEKLMNSQKVTI